MDSYSLERLLSRDLMPFVVAIVTILMCVVAVIVGSVVKIVKMIIVHRERMAKIAQGMDPDHVPPPAPRP